MWEQLKAGLVLLFFLTLFFVVGVMVGLKLPENEAWQHWRGACRAEKKQLKPVDVAVIQFPGGNCSGGVCKVEPPAAAEPAPEKETRLTFYEELSDHPDKARPQAQAPVAKPAAKPAKKVRKVSKKAPVSPEKAAAVTAATAVRWEVRICSLPQEIKARLERSRLLKKYPGIEIEPVKVVGKGTWYRVKITNIADRSVAERYQQELLKTGKYKPIIVKHN
jgi:hypothetical protein